MSELLIRAVRPWGGAVSDMRIRDGRIVETGPDLVAATQTTVFEAQGCIAIPGLINAHTHVDKTLWGTPWHPHQAGPTVLERINNERHVLQTLDLSVQSQSEHLARYLIACGTTHVRTHVDIEPGIGLKHFHGVQQMRETFREWLDVEIVAFPQCGVMTRPGTLELLEQALSEGADVVGGIDPVGIDRDPKGQLDGIFDLAARRGVGIDIHLHDSGEMGAVSIEMIAERTRALGLQGNVVVSHAFCLGSVSPGRCNELVDLLASLDIAVMTHGPGGGAPAPPVRLLHERGVRVFSGTDGIRDAWGPLNSGDMLERAYLVSYINGFRDDPGLELSLTMATYAGAQVVGARDYGLEAGSIADLVLVPGQTIAEVVAAHPPRRLVVKKGQLVARDGQCLLPTSQ